MGTPESRLWLGSYPSLNTMSQKNLAGMQRGPLEQGSSLLLPERHIWGGFICRSCVDLVKTKIISHPSLWCWVHFPPFARQPASSQCRPRKVWKWTFDTIKGIHAVIFLEKRSLFRLSHLKSTRRFSFWFSPPQAASHSLRPSRLIPTSRPCLLTLRRRMFCFFKQAWTPISSSVTWYSLVATVVSHLALLLIWSEVIKEIILTQLHFPEFPEVASSAPCLYFLFQINFVLTPQWEWIWQACCVDFHENKVGLYILIPTRAPIFF